MLDGLDQINWKEHRLEEAPQWITHLASSDEKEANKAYVLIKENILQEEDDFENDGRGISKILNSDGPILILPFLLELLTYETVEGKKNILDLLLIMLRYFDMRYEGEAYAEKARIIYNEIWKHKTTFLDLLTHPLPKVRQESFILLSHYTEHTKETAPHLFHQLEQEKDDQTKAMMLWFWQFDVSKYDSLLELSKNWLTSDHHISLRATATFFLTRFLKENAPQECEAIIIHTLLWYHDPYILPVTWSSCLTSLVNLGKARGIPVALQIIERTKDPQRSLMTMLAALLLAFNRTDLHEELNYTGHVSDITGFLEVSFPKPQREDYLLTNKMPDEPQKQVLRAAVESDVIWSVKTNLFSILGLPVQRDNLAKILNEAE